MLFTHIDMNLRDEMKPQCVAVCCSVLPHGAVCCRVLQCVAVCCSVLQCVAVLQCAAVCVYVCVALYDILLQLMQVSISSILSELLQCVAVCCSVSLTLHHSIVPV